MKVQTIIKGIFYPSCSMWICKISRPLQVNYNNTHWILLRKRSRLFTYLLGHATDRHAKVEGLVVQTRSLAYERHLRTVDGELKGGLRFVLIWFER